MDKGDYSRAETSYRSALSFDNNFLVGKSVLARLTTDLDERIKLYSELEKNKSKINGDERLILEVYIALTNYTNLRDQDSPKTKAALDVALELGANNFGIITHKYPNEVYLKSEYFEMLHSKLGPEKTLDSINTLTLKTQNSNPFIMGYKAILKAEIGAFEEALALANQLKINFKNEKCARPDAILADIYFKMEDYNTAKVHADIAHQIDPRNLDASRLKNKIDDKLDAIK